MTIEAAQALTAPPASFSHSTRTFPAPTVFLAYLRETSTQRVLESERLRWIFHHLGATTLFFYVPSTGPDSFRLKLEELFLFNYTRAFQIYPLSATYRVDFDEAFAFVRDEFEARERLVPGHGLSAEAALDAPVNELARLPFLRIFREQYSICTFYAALDHLLCLMHCLCLIDFAIFRKLTLNESATRLPLASSVVDAVLNHFSQTIFVSKTAFVDGNVFQCLQRTQKILAKRSPFHHFLSSPVSAELNDLLNEIFCALDVSTRLPQRASWLRALDSVVGLRNATKGHGVLYFVNDEFIRGLVSLSTAAMEALAASCASLRFEAEERLLDPVTFTHYRSLDESHLDSMNQLRVNLTWPGHACSVFPYLLWSPIYGFFLFAGLDSKAVGAYMKNYATGIHEHITNFVEFVPR